MGTQHIAVTVETKAGRPAVWKVLADSASYADWGIWSRSEIEREGRSEPQGLGAIRRLTQGRRTLREEIVAYESPARLDYAVLDGIPVRDYVARVDLTERADGGTTISWRSTFSAAPLLDVVIRRKLQRVIHDVATRMAKQAERASAPTSA